MLPNKLEYPLSHLKSKKKKTFLFENLHNPQNKEISFIHKVAIFFQKKASKESRVKKLFSQMSMNIQFFQSGIQKKDTDDLNLLVPYALYICATLKHYRGSHFALQPSKGVVFYK